MSKDLPHKLQQGTNASPAETINERYAVVRCLGRGGMGDVCLVHDNLKGGMQLALKRVRQDRIDSKSVAVLRNEFLALASLPHPNLSRVYDFGVDRKTGDLFFTAEFVDGVDWLKASRTWKLDEPEGIELFFGLLSQVLRGLEYIHCRGLVHGDIKPENLLVTSGDKDSRGTSRGPQMKIIDFGLARKPRVLGGEKILGTPYYVAPETILGSQIDRRTDLYSLGVVLYHLVTGRPPFLGDSNLVILRGHVEKAPVPPQKLIPKLPEDLGDFILRLMQKSPGDRFDGAVEAMDYFNRLFNFAVPLETLETSRSYPEVAALVGREAERGQLRSIFIAASGMAPESFEGLEESPWHADWSPGALEEQIETRLPAGRMAILLGEKGLGKRRLVEDLFHVGQTLGARFIEVECEGRGEVSEGGLESLLDELSRFDWPSWKNGLPPHIQSALLLGDSQEDIDDRVTRDGIDQAIKEVAEALFESGCEQPTVLHFHDLHLGSKTVLAVIRAVVELVTRQGGSRLLMTATAVDRVEEGEFQRLRDDVAFRNQVHHLKVERLREAQVRSYVEAAFPGGHFPDGFCQRILEESDGNLEVVLAILNHFLEKGKIVRRVSGWELEGDYENEDFPGKIRGELKTRIAQLPEDALRLAMAFACLGDGCDPALAIELAAIPPERVGRCLSVLQERNILESRPEEGYDSFLTFVHSSTRTIVYGLIPDGQLAALHERAGTLLEGSADTSGASSRALAHHFLKAGNREKGVANGLSAAREMTGEGLLVEAIHIYEQVLALVDSTEEKLIATVEGELAALRFRIGDYGGVLDLLESRESTAGASAVAAVSRVHGARARMRLGHFREAAHLLETAGQPEGSEIPETVRHAVLLARAELHSLRGDPVESLRWCRNLLEEDEQSMELRTRCQLHLLQGENFSLLQNDQEAATSCQTALRLIDSRREGSLLGWSLFCRGKYYVYRSQLRKALKQFKHCLAISRKSSSFVRQADCLREMGRIQCVLGRPQDARPLLEEALRIYEKSRDLSSTLVTLRLLGESARQTGDTELCTRSLKEVLERSGPLEQDRIRLDVLLTFAAHSIDDGDLQRGNRNLQQAEAHCSERGGTGAGRLGVLALTCEAHLHAGRPAEALAVARRGLLASREFGHVHHQARFLTTTADILCRLGRTGEARRSLVVLTDVSKRHELTVSEGWAKLIEGTLLIRQSRHSEAEKALARARAVFLRLGSERDLARLQLEHGRLCLSLRNHEQAYLDFKEGLHLARKLGLRYLQCELNVSMGKLEAAINKGEVARPAECFRKAGVMALEKGYPEILWQARVHLGRLLEACGRNDEARGCYQEAQRTLQQLVQALPRDSREPYLGTLDSEERALLETHTLILG